MATVIPDTTVPLLGGREHFLLRRLHSLTGILFGLYVIVHLIVNATLVQANDVYQVQVGKIHSLPFLWAVEWTFIYIPLIFHAVYGIWVTLAGQPNNTNYPYAKNWYYLAQRVSAVILVFFILFHVLALKYGLFGSRLSFDAHNATRTVHTHMNVGWWVAWFIYPVGILAGCFHLANGFWTAGISWGLTVSAGAQRRWGLLCLGLFVVAMVLGMTALLAGTLLDPARVAVGH